MESRVQQFVAEELWLLIGIVTFALAGLAAIAGFGGLTPVIGIIGWFLLAPIFLFWGEEIAEAVFNETKPAADTVHNNEEDALSELKRRYAEGEIDDDEFEHRLDRLLQVDHALDDVFTANSNRSREEDDVYERERELE